MSRSSRLAAVVGCIWAGMIPGTTRADNINDATEAAMKTATRVAAPWVAKIETSGGQEVVAGVGRGGRPGPGVRKGVGPTTGMVVGKDGYIISSAFNFANNPTDVFVSVPGHPRMVATIVANDTTRMLTLLKVNLDGLSVPKAFPEDQVRVGQWALALGRALDPDISETPSVSVGIVSAVGRVWGKAIQTDAKISPTNYGGPLVAIDGRVIGVLVPASPQGEGETAGVEWYDSGIGFAIPTNDVFAAFERMKGGNDLRRGLLGITPKQSEELYNLPMVIGTVASDSAAEKAGIKSDDTITAVDDTTIRNFSDLRHALGTKYEGDTVRVTVERDGKSVDIGMVTLSGQVQAYVAPFLGILPMRDDTEPGVEIRYVYPDSPAAKAGLAAGDRIAKLGPPGALPSLPKGARRPGVAVMTPVKDRDQLTAAISRLKSGAELKVEVKRKAGKTESMTFKIGTLTDALPDTLPLPSSVNTRPVGDKKDPKPADEEVNNDEAEIEAGLSTKTHGALGREYWMYVPHSYEKSVSHGLILWLHDAGKGGKDADDMADFWGPFCERHHFVIVAPKSRNEGWVASESEDVVQILNDVIEEYNVDRKRVVAHGLGVGGQMAYYLGFHARDLIRGVATSGAALNNPPKDTVATQPLAFFIVAGKKDPLLPAIEEGKTKLEEKQFPVLFRAIPEFGKEYLTLPVMRELQRWMDTLDKI